MSDFLVGKLKYRKSGYRDSHSTNVRQSAIVLSSSELSNSFPALSADIVTYSPDEQPHASVNVNDSIFPDLYLISKCINNSTISHLK